MEVGTNGMSETFLYSDVKLKKQKISIIPISRFFVGTRISINQNNNFHFKRHNHILLSGVFFQILKYNRAYRFFSNGKVLYEQFSHCTYDNVYY